MNKLTASRISINRNESFSKSTNVRTTLGRPHTHGSLSGREFQKLKSQIHIIQQKYKADIVSEKKTHVVIARMTSVSETVKQRLQDVRDCLTKIETVSSSLSSNVDSLEKQYSLVQQLVSKSEKIMSRLTGIYDTKVALDDFSQKCIAQCLNALDCNEREFDKKCEKIQQECHKESQKHKLLLKKYDYCMHNLREASQSIDRLEQHILFPIDSHLDALHKLPKLQQTVHCNAAEIAQRSNLIQRNIHFLEKTTFIANAHNIVMSEQFFHDLPFESRAAKIIFPDQLEIQNDLHNCFRIIQKNNRNLLKNLSAKIKISLPLSRNEADLLSILPDIMDIIVKETLEFQILSSKYQKLISEETENLQNFKEDAQAEFQKKEALFEMKCRQEINEFKENLTKNSEKHKKTRRQKNVEKLSVSKRSNQNNFQLFRKRRYFKRGNRFAELQAMSVADAQSEFENLSL